MSITRKCICILGTVVDLDAIECLTSPRGLCYVLPRCNISDSVDSHAKPQNVICCLPQTAVDFCRNTLESLSEYLRSVS